MRTQNPNFQSVKTMFFNNGLDIIQSRYRRDRIYMHLILQVNFKFGQRVPAFKQFQWITYIVQVEGMSAFMLSLRDIRQLNNFN